MRTLFLVLAAAVILGGAVGALSFMSGQKSTPTSTPAPITFQEDTRASRLELLVAQKRGESETLFLCQKGGCAAKSRPEAGEEIVAAGNAWYFYENDQLVKLVGEAREGEALVAKTPLVAPRGLFMSPDGAKLAYFLDNIHDSRQELTELWYLDTATGERHLIAEHLTRPDILTTPRWNSSSTHLTFVADSGQNKEKKIEFVVAAVSPPAVVARFTEVDWEKLQSLAETGLLDVGFTGRSLAFIETVSPYRANLTIIHEGSPPQTSVIRGQVPFLEWLSDGRLLYAVQDDTGASLWNVRSTVHTFVGRFPGQLKVARRDPSGDFIVGVTDQGGRLIWNTFHLASEAVSAQGPLPEAGEIAILAIQEKPAEKPATAGISTALKDEEIVAFIQENLAEISQEPTAAPRRIITTREPNVIYLDYTANSGEDHRLLLTIRDAVHPEWSIRGRYEPAGGEWRKTQGGGLADPAAKNIYEWEASLNQWILKSSAQ